MLLLLIFDELEEAGDVFRPVETSAGSLHEFICDVAQEVGGKTKADLCGQPLLLLNVEY